MRCFFMCHVDYCAHLLHFANFHSQIKSILTMLEAKNNLHAFPYRGLDILCLRPFLDQKLANFYKLTEIEETAVGQVSTHDNPNLSGERSLHTDQLMVPYVRTY